MPFNLDKCHILHTGTTNQVEKCFILGTAISSVTQERDLVVVITANLKSCGEVFYTWYGDI